MVGEPSVDETIEILYGLRDRYEKHHKLVISDEALVAAAKFSDQYIADRFLPELVQILPVLACFTRPPKLRCRAFGATFLPSL